MNMFSTSLCSTLPLFLLVLVPFAVFSFCYFFARSIPFKFNQLVATGPVAAICILAVCFVFTTPQPTIVVYDLWPFSEYLVWVQWSFVFDSISTLMSVVVLWVTFAVLMFAMYYMATDPFTFKFLNFLVLFAGCMILFVVAENLLIMFCGWEALGVCSFALIGFWNTRLQAVKAALKAITLNRVGDTAFLIAMVVTWFEFKTLSFADLDLIVLNHVSSTFRFLGHFTISTIDVIALLFLLAAAAKSAQLGFHVWLSDAMEGPTPVSALLHAATMVTAGVYLLIRIGSLFSLSPAAQFACMLIGGITALTSAIFAFFQFDLKKMIAFSTSSQVGFMFVACGLGVPQIAFYHLVTHAFFKALLFVCAGCVIHCFDGDQDVRRMGGLFLSQPLLFAAMLVGSLALSGFPFFAGFYSKDMIFGALASSGLLTQTAMFGVLLVAALLTSVYSANMLILIFFGFRRSPVVQITSPAEGTRISFTGWLAIVLLGVPALVGGWATKQISPWVWVAADLGSSPTYSTLVLEAVESLPVLYKLFVLLPPALFCAWFFIQRGAVHFRFVLPTAAKFQFVFAFFQNRAFFENIFYYFFVRPVLNYVYLILLVEVERFILETVVVEGPVRGLAFLSRTLARQHTGSVSVYITSFAISFFFIADICLYFL